MKIVKKSFFNNSTLQLFDKLIGMYLISESDGVRTGGMITEVEAYPGEDDPGSFAYKGRKTKKSKPLYHEPGSIYLYLNYGMYFLLNIITEKRGNAGSILIRAIKPEIGVNYMIERRRKKKNIADGPGKLSIALSLDSSLNGLKVYEKKSILKLYYSDITKKKDIIYTNRIGISKGKNLKYRALLNMS